MKFNSFIKECSEKEVFKRLSIYIVTSWVLIQVLSIIYEPLALSEKSVSILLIVLLICFPFYIYYIWYSKLAPLEHQVENQSKKGKKKHSKFRNTYFSFMGVIGFLSMASAVYITNNSFSSNDIKLTTFESTNKIGILPFNNNTGLKELDVLGKMASDWITHGITENSTDQVISPEIIGNYLTIIKATSDNTDNAGILKKYFKPGKVILGSYFLNDSTLVIKSSITDGNIDKTLIAFKPISCNKNEPLVCIDELKEKILGYLSIMKKPSLNIEEAPPSFKAYEYKLDAETNFDDADLHLELLNKSIKEDPNYFEPKLLRIAHFYNQGDYKTADSLRKVISITARASNRQRNLLNYYSALLEGNNRKVFETILNEYNYTPTDFPTNSSTMVIAVNLVNRLKGLDTIYNAIDMSTMDFDLCHFCKNRIYMQALAKFRLNKYEETITLLKPIVKEINALYLKKLLAASYANSSKITDLDDYLKQEKIVLKPEELLEMYNYLGKQLLIAGDLENSKKYFDMVSDEKLLGPYKELVAEAKFYQKEYTSSKTGYEALLLERPGDIVVLSKLASINRQLGNAKASDELLKQLNQTDREYQFGVVDYQMAKYHASIDEKQLALQYLMKSIADGYFYTPNTYDKDPDFISLNTTSDFNKIMTYWH